MVGGIATGAEVQPQAAVTEEDLAAVAARAGFSFAAPVRSQPPLPGPAAAGGNGSSAVDAGMTGGDDVGDNDSEGDDWAVGVTDGANDDSESGSDIEDLDAMLAEEEAAAAGGR